MPIWSWGVGLAPARRPERRDDKRRMVMSVRCARVAAAIVAAALMLAGCAGPTIECGLADGCEEAAAAAARLLPEGDARWLIVEGGAPFPGFHAEIHACYPDGRYLIVDVTDREGREASLRPDVAGDPPCR